MAKKYFYAGSCVEHLDPEALMVAKDVAIEITNRTFRRKGMESPPDETECYRSKPPQRRSRKAKTTLKQEAEHANDNRPAKRRRSRRNRKDSESV